LRSQDIERFISDINQKKLLDLEEQKKKNEEEVFGLLRKWDTEKKKQDVIEPLEVISMEPIKRTMTLKGETLERWELLILEPLQKSVPPLQEEKLELLRIFL
jgi:hypothetical protein